MNFKINQKIRLLPLEDAKKAILNDKNVMNFLTNKNEIYGITNENYVNLRKNNIYIIKIVSSGAFVGNDGIKNYMYLLPWVVIKNNFKLKIPNEYFKI